jgi:outer membrane usher protein
MILQSRLGTLRFSGQRSLTGARDTSAQMFLSVPIGRRTSASTGMRLRDGVLETTADVQSNLSEGPGITYRASAAFGAVDRLSGTLQVQADIGNWESEISTVDGRSGVRMSVSGSIGALDGQVFASRRLSQSFAAVRVGSYAGVRVYADNQLVGRTNRAGVVIVPGLRPFEDNQIRFEYEDLPIDASVAGGEQTVRPFNRSGVAVRFAAEETSGGLLKVIMENGDPLPAGTVVRLNGKPEEFVSAPGGEVYFTGLGQHNFAVALVGERQCAFRFEFASGQDVQPQLGQFRCEVRKP